MTVLGLQRRSVLHVADSRREPKVKVGSENVHKLCIVRIHPIERGPREHFRAADD